MLVFRKWISKRSSNIFRAIIYISKMRIMTGAEKNSELSKRNSCRNCRIASKIYLPLIFSNKPYRNIE